MCVRLLATQPARVMLKLLPRENQRAQGMPGARCTRGRACRIVSTRVSHHRFTGNIRHSLRNGFNGFLRALPGDRAFLPPSPQETRKKLASRELDTSVGVSGPHGFAVRNWRLRQCATRVHRIPSRVRDDREPPLE
jgi:hypothetical protein